MKNLLPNLKLIFNNYLPEEGIPHDPALDTDTRKALESRDLLFIEEVRDRWGKYYGDDRMYHELEYHRIKVLTDEREIRGIHASLGRFRRQ